MFLNEKDQKSRYVNWLVVIGILFFLLKLWMVGGHEMLAKFRPHDDSLFATLAISILDGNWLGEYNNKTLIKGVGYPLFMALSAWSGIPILTLQHFLYGGACLLVVLALRPVVRNPLVLIAGFLILLFNPLTYSYPLMSATLRASLYLSLSLVVFASMLGLWTSRRDSGWRPVLWATCLGISFAWLWITREESVWIIPAAVFFLAIYLAPCSWNRGSSLLPRVAVVIIPLVILALTQFVIMRMNESYYGVAVANELKADEFTSALGGLMRIKHEKQEKQEEQEEPVIVSKDAQAKAFIASPSFAELEPYLAGGSKYLVSYYIWSLRAAVRRAGYYNNPGNATREFDFYRRVGEEIKTACDSGKLDCHDRKASLRPVWHARYNSQALPVFWELLKTALTGSLFISSSAGKGSKADLDTLFTYDVLTGENTLRKSIYFEDKLPPYYRKMVVKKETLMALAGKVYQYLLPVVFVIALGVHAGGIGKMAMRRMLDPKVVFGLVLLGSIFTVLCLLTYVKITIWPVIRPMHTLSPIILLYVVYMLTPTTDEGVG